MVCTCCHGFAVYAVAHDGEQICEIPCPTCQGLSDHLIVVGDHQPEPVHYDLVQDAVKEAVREERS